MRSVGWSRRLVNGASMFVVVVGVLFCLFFVSYFWMKIYIIPLLNCVFHKSVVIPCILLELFFSHFFSRYFNWMVTIAKYEYKAKWNNTCAYDNPNNLGASIQCFKKKMEITQQQTNKQTKKGGELPDRTLFEFDRWKQGKEKSYLLPTSPVFGPYVTVNAGLFFWP